MKFDLVYFLDRVRVILCVGATKPEATYILLQKLHFKKIVMNYNIFTL